MSCAASGAEHFDPDVGEVQRAACLRGGAIVADVMIERALPVLLELPARDEDHVRVREAFHVAAKIAAIPRGLHAADEIEDRLLLGLLVHRGLHAVKSNISSRAARFIGNLRSGRGTFQG